jgi:3-deoxy-D-manno-octulosonate 8-phosphate phosphatase KdsC-like HAD superfamily phosphatase
LFRSQSHEEIKAKELFKIVRRGGKSAYDEFVEVLLQSETQTSLGELLKRDSIMMDDQHGNPIGYRLEHGI